MARIKKYSPEQNLSSFQTFLIDDNPNSDYFRITEFKDTFTGGKNGFLIEGSEYLKESTEIKIELLDVAGNPIYFEPGNGIPEYYEGISKLIAVYIYNDTPIGLGKITILGELKQYDDNGVKRDIPDQWKGAYNVKWERTFQINKLLANEDKVRFYRRPEVTIDEIVKPIFSGNPPVVTQTGVVDGIPLVPNAGTDLSNFTLPTNYRLKIKSGNKWTGSIDEEIITFDNIDYAPKIEEIVNENEIIVSPPYAENNIVKSFTNESYSLEFPYIENVADLATALTGSFAKISITDMKTFVGDAARVKVFRRSQSNLTDFEFVQEIQLESNEVLRDITTFAKKEEPYGFFTQPVIDEYWVTSSNDFNVTFNQDVLYNSAKLNSSPDNFFFTTESFSIQNGVEYTLDFNVRKGENTSGDYLKVFLSGSNGSTPTSQTITTINSSNGILQKTNINENIIADTFDSARLYFEVSGSDWYVNNVSLKASQETSFSPDEITFVQQVPKFLVTETFDYRFEFYDINNNFIPVRVEDTKTFVGGNVNLFEKDIEITPDNLYFSFDSASNPANALPPTIINLEVLTDLVTGSITYTSGAYDLKGNLLSSSQYVGGQYPGYLTDWDVNFGRQPFLRVEDFTGSRDDITVQFIRYTGAIEGVSDDFVISRVEDGKGGVSFEIVPFRGVQIKNKESKTLEIQAVRVDGINRIDLRAGLDRGFSDAKLHVLSSSLDGTQTYVSLSQAITNPDFLEGVSVGETGSGEIDYNAIFNRDAIDNELTVYLMDGPLSESILTSQILTDLKDGLNPGLVTSTADQFNIKYKPREAFSFDPTEIIVTSSFQQRGTTLNPLSASLKVIPSASIAPLTELPELFVFYETGAFDDSIGVVVTDFVGNVIDSGVPGVTAGVSYYDAVETKQLNFEFTYTEPITSASVTANKSFFITPDGLPGQDSITIDIDPNPVALGSNHKGDVYNYALADTDIQITQGDLFLINTASGNPGTFTTTSIVPINITYGTLVGDSTTTMSLAGFESMSALSASVQYNFDIHPYFTASLITASRTQKFTKVVEGGGPIEVTLDPIATALNADEIGFVSDYSSATTEVFIKQNDEFFFYDEYDGGRPGTFVTASISASNIEFTELSSSFRDLSVSGSISSSGGEVLHFKGFGGLANNQPSASITYNFKVYPYSLTAGVAGVPRIVSKTQTFSKVNDGTAARKVSLVASSDTVIYDGDGVKVAPSGDVVLSATAINVTGSAFFKFLNVDGSTIQASSTVNTTTIGDLPATGSTKTFTVELRDGTSDGTIVDTDSVTISGIAEGSTAYSAQLSNPASSVTVEVDGTTYFDNAGTLLRAYKGGTELQYVEEYDESAVDPITFLPIGTFGQFSASIYEISSFLTQGTLRDSKEIVSSSGELYASSSAVTNWNSPQQNTQGFIVFKIDFENGRGEQFVQQSFSTVFEGATGPGIVVRGEWDEEIAYIFDLTQKRRDAVFREISGDVHYWATTEELINKSEYTEESDGLGNDDGIYTAQPVYNGGSPPSEGDIDAGGWQYLGQQDFFVAAKLAIFEESFVKNTINVGEPPAGNDNANIAIVGGTDKPYIAVGQTGTQGFGQPGAFLGVTNDMGGAGVGANSTSGILSLTGTDNGGSYNQLKWDGETLTIRGSIRQTSAGATEPSLRGIWATATVYAADDLVIYNGQSWTANSAHTSDASGGASDGPPAVGPWTAASGTGKTVGLAASDFVITFDQDGNNPSPTTIDLIASSSNFIDPYFKFTGGSTFFTDQSTYANSGETNGNNEIISSIDLSTTTISDMPLQFRVGVADGGLSGQGQNELISDVINVFGVKPGSDTDPNFFITPTAGGTQIKNSTGTITLQVQKADLNGVANITSGTDARIYDTGTGDLITSSIHATETVAGGVVYNPTLGSGFINGTKTLLLKDNGGNVLDSITLLDVTDGLGGGSFIASNLKTSRDPITNNYTPTTLTLQASFYDTSGTEYTKNVTITPNWSGTVDQMKIGTATGASQITITADDGDGTSMTLGDTSYTDTKDVVVTAVFTDPATSQTTTINETFYIISDGADGIDAITVINTNQAHSLPASSAGVVSSYTNSGTNIRVFEGTTELSYFTTPLNDGTWGITTTQSPSSTITIGSVTDNGDDIDIGNHSNMDNNEDTVTITYNISGKRLLGDAFTATTTQTLTKVKDGTDGADGDAAGVVYAGAWEVGTNNTYSDPTEYLSGDLKYVVKYDDGNGDRFYTTEIEHYHRGTWVANTQDYAVNDIVYNPTGTGGPDGTYYAANSSITGQSRTTNPQASSLWDSLGSAANLVPMNGNGGLQLDGEDAFAIFGAEFTSVATDILFAEDVYANRTINVGTGENNKPVISLNADTENDSASPYISIGQTTQSFEQDGIFLGYPSESASPVMSLVSGSDYFIYNDGVIALSNAALLGTGSNAIIQGPGLQIGYKLDTQYNSNDNRSYNFTVTQGGIVSASQAYVEGTINANSGRIGQWRITEPDEDGNGDYIDGTGGVLRDSDGELRFDPNEAEIQIYSASYDDTSIEFPATSSVSASNGRFYIDYGNGAELAPVIHLERSSYASVRDGSKVQNVLNQVDDERAGYYFDLSDSSMAGHEFSFSMRVDGIGTYGGRYNKSTTLDTSETGQNFLIITSSASPGSTGAYIQITPSASMESPWAGGNGLVGDPSSMEFHYYCENHTGMGNRTYIYNDGLAIEREATYIERITIGSQNSFTSTEGGSGNFSFAQSAQTFYRLLSGTTTVNQYGFLQNATANEYTAFSTSTTNLDAGPITLTDIAYPTLHVTSNNIPDAEFTSQTPNYSPSYDGQVHGGNFLFAYPSAGYRRIYLYLELWNDDDEELVSTKYLSQVYSAGSSDGTHQWVADDSGGSGIQSVIGTTKITLEDGNTKLAKDITLDDKILAWDSDTDKWVSARISDIKKRNVSEIYKVTIDGNEIEVSDSHGFWLFGNQKNSGQIKVSELYKYKLAGNPMTQDSLKLWVKDGDSKKKVAITNIRKIEKEEEVITFSVPNYVNYVSNNIISHNVFGGLYWYQQSMDYGNSAMGARTTSGGTTSWDIEIPENANYKVRFKITLISRASTSVTVGRTSSATVTNDYDSFNFYFDSDNSNQTGYLNGGYAYGSSPFNAQINVQKNNNFIEIVPAGIQVVSGTGRFVRINRRDQNDDDVELLEVIDGAVKIESRAEVSNGTTADDKMALSIAGNIKPTPNAASSDTTSGWNLGGSSNYFREGWMRELNGTPIGTMQLVAACYFGVSTTGTMLGPYNTTNVSGVTRSQKGRFTVTLTSTTGFTLSSGLGFASGYGRNGSTDGGPGTNMGDGEFSFNVGVKVKSANIEVNVKDNNNDNDRDPKYVYFVLFAD